MGSLDLSISELVAVPPLEAEDGMVERHRIFLLLLASLVHHYWCGNKVGDEEYPLNPAPGKYPDAKYLEAEYKGHNIAALAVDGAGTPIDFEFNHNHLFNSSVEHAESRLVRRLFALVQGWDSDLRATQEGQHKYGNALSDVTIYTSLESCSQCAGIMALGQVKEVVYLQDDPGMHRIGAILFNLTKETRRKAPQPIPGSDVAPPVFDALNAAYQKFLTAQSSEAGKPFVLIGDDSEPQFSSSLTSFLCTDAAYGIFAGAASDFGALPLSHALWSPRPNQKTNGAVYEAAMQFWKHATSAGMRGTPHRA